MLKTLVKETANNPGTGTSITTLGAPTGYRTFLTAFGSGATAYYQITDGTKWEVNTGTVTAGNLTRGTPVETSTGSTSRLNFTGAVTIFNFQPAGKTLYADASDVFQAGTRRIANVSPATAATDAANLTQVGWKQIGAATDAGTTTVVRYSTTTYKRYRLEWMAYMTSAAPVYARFSVDNGVTYKFGASDYTYAGALLRASGYVGAGATSSFIALSDTPVAGERTFGYIEFDTNSLIGTVESSTVAAGPVMSKWSAGFVAALVSPITNIELGSVSSTFAGIRCRLLGGF